jgi:transcriptional regulator with XRE-family HTH domain
MLTGNALFHINTDKLRTENVIREQIADKLSDKEYRDAFVSEQINTGLAFQLRAMRELRGWSQTELGEKVGMAQSRVSVMEDANYSRYSLNTLKRLASAFDVALTVRFERFSTLVDHFSKLDSATLDVASFEEDTFSSELLASSSTVAFLGEGLTVSGTWSPFDGISFAPATLAGQAHWIFNSVGQGSDISPLTNTVQQVQEAVA